MFLRNQDFLEPVCNYCKSDCNDENASQIFFRGQEIREFSCQQFFLRPAN